MNPAASANGNPGFVLAIPGDKRRQGERERRKTEDGYKTRLTPLRMSLFPSLLFYIYLYRPIVISSLTFFLLSCFFYGILSRVSSLFVPNLVGFLPRVRLFLSYFLFLFFAYLFYYLFTVSLPVPLSYLVSFS